MQLTYYNNRSDERYVNKNITAITLQDHSNPVNIELLKDTDIVHPTFIMADKDLYMTANYCYVDSLHRYYYIRDIKVSKGYAYLQCECDVLMSYKEALKTIPAIISRNYGLYNLYQNDDRWKVYSYTAKRTIEFSGGFDYDTQQFILGVVGNAQGGSDDNGS
jgi:hypothetical protein